MSNEIQNNSEKIQRLALNKNITVDSHNLPMSMMKPVAENDIDSQDTATNEILYPRHDLLHFVETSI